MTSPAELEVVALTVVVVATAATVVVVATAATVVAVTAVGIVVEVKIGAFCHLSFLPTLVQMRGLDAEPFKIPAREHSPPPLAADTCWVGTMIAKTLVTTNTTIF